MYTTVLNINYYYYYYYSECFLMDHVTQDRSNDAENSALITGISYILQYIQIESSCCT